MSLKCTPLGCCLHSSPRPLWLSWGSEEDADEPVDRRVCRRNLSNKIKAKKKKRFYFKNRFVGFFPFCIQYIVIQTSQYYIQIHDILKKPISDAHFKRTLFCNAPVGREKVRDLPLRRRLASEEGMLASVYISWLIGGWLSWPPGRKLLSSGRSVKVKV